MRVIPLFMRFRFPIRFKILITQLLVVTTAVAVITFTMAGLFHDDKTTYIHDLTSVMALQMAEEAGSLLTGYRDKLQVFAGLMSERELPQEQKARMMKRLFGDFSEFVLITRYDGKGEKVTVYDARALESAGLQKSDFTAYFENNPLPLDLIREGKIVVENASLSDKMPTLTLAVAEAVENKSGKPPVIAAIVRLDSLLNLARRSRVFESYLLDEKGMFLSHSDTKKVTSRSRTDELPELGEFRKQETLGTTLEYSQGGKDMIGGFGRVEFGGLISGVQIPKSTAYMTARSLLNSLLGVALALLIASSLLSLFWSRRLTRPIEKLSEATKVVGRGEFGINVEIPSNDEIGGLAESFNQMASELKTREKALQEAQTQLIQSEKMAAFGQLGAGIAHEVKNPLAGILGYAQLTLRKLETDNPLHNNLKIIEKETKRCKTIIDNLLKFARQEKVAYMQMDINTVVEDAAAIVDHELGIHQVKLEKNLAAGLPQISGNSNQIQQVLMNLMINAQQAMEGHPGVITIQTVLADFEHLEIRVGDNGPGIPKELQEKIFEPFFTTKSAGKGTGLGLSVSYGIIKEHGGEISIQSEPGSGTLFTILLPVESIGKATAMPSKMENAAG